MKLFGFCYISVVAGSRIPRDGNDPNPCHQKRLENVSGVTLCQDVGLLVCRRRYWYTSRPRVS